MLNLLVFPIPFFAKFTATIENDLYISNILFNFGGLLFCYSNVLHFTLLYSV